MVDTPEDAVNGIVASIADAEAAAEQTLRRIVRARSTLGLHYNATSEAIALAGHVVGALGQLHRELKRISVEVPGIPPIIVPQGGGGGGK
jgi:hypothetical protein